ncbi:MAG: PfkB family carbohydrate kinase, partial [Solirubrobacteraceae bacterium]
ETLAAEGVDGRFAWTDGETRSSLSVADRETGRLTEFYEDGGAITDGKWREVEAMVAEILPDARWLALAGSLPPGTGTDGYCRLIEMAHEAGVASAIDSRGDALSHTLQSCPTLVKINVHEAGELLDRELADLEEVRRAAQEIRAQAGGEGHAVTITMGEEGMVAIDPQGCSYRARVHTRGNYPVGSGDATLAGILAGLDRGATWREAIGLGLGAAAANAETPGAGLVDPDRAAELAAAAEVEVI